MELLLILAFFTLIIFLWSVKHHGRLEAEGNLGGVLADFVGFDPPTGRFLRFVYYQVVMSGAAFGNVTLIPASVGCLFYFLLGASLAEAVGASLLVSSAALVIDIVSTHWFPVLWTGYRNGWDEKITIPGTETWPIYFAFAASFALAGVFLEAPNPFFCIVIGAGSFLLLWPTLGTWKLFQRIFRSNSSSTRT